MVTSKDLLAEILVTDKTLSVGEVGVKKTLELLSTEEVLTVTLVCPEGRVEDPTMLD